MHGGSIGPIDYHNILFPDRKHYKNKASVSNYQRDIGTALQLLLHHKDAILSDIWRYLFGRLYADCFGITITMINCAIEKHGGRDGDTHVHANEHNPERGYLYTTPKKRQEIILKRHGHIKMNKLINAPVAQHMITWDNCTCVCICIPIRDSVANRSAIDKSYLLLGFTQDDILLQEIRLKHTLCLGKYQNCQECPVILLTTNYDYDNNVDICRLESST